MPPIVNAEDISKAFGAKPLFEKVSFTVSGADRIGLIGPNGVPRAHAFRLPNVPQTKLSYLEAREYAGIEQRITEAEQRLYSKRATLEDPAIASDAPKLVAAQTEMEAAQNDLDTLYARWAELQEKAESLSRR